MYGQMNDILNMIFFGNTVKRYILTAFVLLIGLLAVKLLIRGIVGKIKILAAKTETTIDDFIAKIMETVVLPLSYFVAVYLGLKSLVFPETLEKALNYIVLSILVFFVVKFLIEFVGYALSLYTRKRSGDPALEKSIPGILIVVKFIIWSGALIFLLDNLGFKISAVITGLGIGGVAVALAAQAVLKDLFGYFCILFDHPFKVGDFIVVGDFMGNIEHVGIKTTRIRSLGGEVIVFSNSDLTDSRVRNYKLMERRRIVFKVAVIYDTPLEKLEKIPQLLKNIVSGVKDTLFDRAHFAGFGDFSLNFEIVYYVLSGDYNKYMDVQQEINFAIKREFEKAGICFAYPTQTVLLSRDRS